MQLAAFIVTLPTFLVEICFAGLVIENSEPDRSRLVQASIDILESCYADRIGTVGLAGAAVGIIIEAMSLRDTVIPVALIDETPGNMIYDPVDGTSGYKLQVFVVTVTDPNNLPRTLLQIKNSKWWNHMASFVLIDWTTVKNGCSNAYKSLWEAWKMNLLNSKFLCLHRTKGRLIYTFNPYTTKAPVPWQQENTYNGINDHVWTLFVQDYREDESRCEALDFDKTLDIGGYEIRASVTGMDKWQSPDSSIKPSLLNQAQAAAAQILMRSMNATWNVRSDPESSGPLLDEKGNPRASAADVISGKSDIYLNIVDRGNWIKHETTYPNFRSSLVIMTQYRGHKSQLGKLISVLDMSSRLCVLASLVITLLFFKYYVRQPLIRAMLNIVLILCNAALWMIPKKLAPRIYLGTLFMLVITIHGIYQGKLASLLTKQVRLPDIESIDDLAQSGHVIYGLTQYQYFFNESAFDGRYVAVREFNCTSYVLRDPKNVCIGEKLRLTNEAAKFELHLSQKPIGTLWRTYIIRPDWPLKDRVNAIYRRATEGDIMIPRYAVDLNNFIRKLESYQKEEQEQAFKPLTLGQLSFAFVALAIGLGCAAITYIIELSIYDRPIANPRNRIRRRITLVA